MRTLLRERRNVWQMLSTGNHLGYEGGPDGGLANALVWRALL